jgi:hypothetical protein
MQGWASSSLEDLKMKEAASTAAGHGRSRGSSQSEEAGNEMQLNLDPRCGAVADVAGDLLRLVEPQAFLPVPSPLMTSNEIARLIFVVTSLIRRPESRRLTCSNLVKQPFGRPLTRKWKTTTASLSPGFVPIPDACAWLSAGTRQNSP